MLGHRLSNFVHPGPLIALLALGALGVAEAREAEVSLGAWISPSIQEQLDRDPTIVNMGKGAIFVPSMTDPLNEPPVMVLKDKEEVATGPTGKRIIVNPGTYDIAVGSGTLGQLTHQTITVTEGEVAIVKPTWSALQLRVVNDKNVSFRGSYELIRMPSREEFGVGYGADEERGEIVRTWLLPPGLYKIIKPGENYRSRTNFSTVQINKGELTRYVLVQDETSSDFLGAGVAVEPLSATALGNWRLRLVVGGDVSFNRKDHVIGADFGNNFAFNVFLDSFVQYSAKSHYFWARLSMEEGISKQIGASLRKSVDLVDFDILYIYEVTTWFGPYASAGIDTVLIPGSMYFESPTTAILMNSQGQFRRIEENITEIKVADSLSPTTIKEGAGANFRIFRNVWVDLDTRVGLGFRQIVEGTLYQLKDDPDTPEVEFMDSDDYHIEGIDTTVVGSARITRWFQITTEFTMLLPFDNPKEPVFEFNTTASFRLFSFASLNYLVKITRDRNLNEFDSVEQNLLLRFSFEIL